MPVYIEEFTFRGRDPENEPKQPAAYHVVLAQFETDFSGVKRQRKSDPLSAKQADDLGFPLQRILDEITAQALRDKDAAETEAAEAVADKEEAQAAFAQADQAVKAASTELSRLGALTGALAKAKQDAEAQRDALAAELAAEKAKAAGTEDATVISKLTFGLIKNF